MKACSSPKIVRVGRVSRVTRALSMGINAELGNPLLRYTVG